MHLGIRNYAESEDGSRRFIVTLYPHGAFNISRIIPLPLLPPETASYSEFSVWGEVSYARIIEYSYGIKIPEEGEEPCEEEAPSDEEEQPEKTFREGAVIYFLKRDGNVVLYKINQGHMETFAKLKGCN